MKNFWISLTLLVLFQCHPSEKHSPEMDNYDLAATTMDGWTHAHLKNIDGNVVEEGYFYHGQKTGTWTLYQPKGGDIAEMASYIEGRLHGPMIKLDDRGQLLERAYFKNNKLDGYYEKYEYGKKKLTAYYQDGELNGRVTKYINFTNKVLSEADYKNGKLDGVYRHYDDQGNITLEYEYSNGEKINGGIVE